MVDDHGEVVDIGVEGNLEVKTPHIFFGYRGMEDESKKEFTKDGFFKTGWVLICTYLKVLCTEMRPYVVYLGKSRSSEHYLL